MVSSSSSSSSSTSDGKGHQEAEAGTNRVIQELELHQEGEEACWVDIKVAGQVLEAM